VVTTSVASLAARAARKPRAPLATASALSGARPSSHSGFFVPGQSRDIARVRTKDGALYVVARNNDRPRLFAGSSGDAVGARQGVEKLREGINDGLQGLRDGVRTVMKALNGRGSDDDGAADNANAKDESD